MNISEAANFVKSSMDNIKSVKEDINNIIELFKGDEDIERNRIDEISAHIEEVLLWRKNAKGEKDIRQADTALEILHNELPIKIKAIFAEETTAEQIAGVIQFGLRIAKIVLLSI